MTLAESVIRECIEKKITDKKTIARELCSKDPALSIEQARSIVRHMLGSAGKPVPTKWIDLYNLYRKSCFSEDQYEIAAHRELKPSAVYIITTALNNTPVHGCFWKNLLKYAQFRKAEICVIAARYKNPTSIFTDRNEDVWTEEVIPYLDAARHIIFPGVHLMADVKISPTASTPLTGMNGMSGPESCIFGHPRVEMEFMPVPKGSPAKVMMTTGVCTQPNYTDSKAGKKGAFHHTFGFVIATEFDFHQVTATDSGDFIDYEFMVTDGQVLQAPPLKALVFGDIHTAKLTEESRSRMMYRIRKLKPELVVLHDVLDCESVNPHEEKNPILKAKRYASGKGDLAAEIDQALLFLKKIRKLCRNVVIVRSNHDDMLDRYLINTDWRKDLPNAEKYAEFLQIALKHGSVFPYLAKKIGVTATNVNDSVKVMGIELNLHGDRGANGSRGSSVQFKNLSSKTIVAHAHTPYRHAGCVGVGCQDLEHGYNEGLSSWGIGDASIDVFGKIQHYF